MSIFKQLQHKVKRVAQQDAMKLLFLLLGLAVFGFLLGCVIIYLVRTGDKDQTESQSILLRIGDKDQTESQSITVIVDEGVQIDEIPDFAESYNFVKHGLGFESPYPIEVHIVQSVNGAINIANTVYGGRTTVMHFPVFMAKQESVRVHELTHAVLGPFELPTWATEGFAVWMESKINPGTHPLVSLGTPRKDKDGVNLVQHWREGQGIYADPDLTQWCYSYSRSLIDAMDDIEWHKVLAGQVFDYDSYKFVHRIDQFEEGSQLDWFQKLGFDF